LPKDLTERATEATEAAKEQFWALIARGFRKPRRETLILSQLSGSMTVSDAVREWVLNNVPGASIQPAHPESEPIRCPQCRADKQGMKKEPQVMTFIYKDYPQNSFVALLVSQGPKNFTLRLKSMSEGGGWREGTWQTEKVKYILITGDRQDLVDMVKKARADHEAAHEKRSRDRQEAIHDFECQWDKDHPYPPSLDIPGLIAPYLLVPGKAVNHDGKA
jgi:hypothetical protein